MNTKADPFIGDDKRFFKVIVRLFTRINNFTTVSSKDLLWGGMVFFNDCCCRGLNARCNELKMKGFLSCTEKSYN